MVPNFLKAYFFNSLKLCSFLVTRVETKTNDEASYEIDHWDSHWVHAIFLNFPVAIHPRHHHGLIQFDQGGQGRPPVVSGINYQQMVFHIVSPCFILLRATNL